jgi:hypothetical protein
MQWRGLCQYIRQKQCYNINLWFAKILEKKPHNAVIRQSEYQPGNVFVIGDKSQ